MICFDWVVAVLLSDVTGGGQQIVEYSEVSGRSVGQVNVLMPAANLIRDRLTAVISRGSWRIGLVGAGDRGVPGRRLGLTGISEQRCVVSAGF